MVNKELINQVVNEEFEKLISFNELEVYQVTSSIPKLDLKNMVAFDIGLITWIRHILESNKEIATDAFKVTTLKEMFEIMDKHFNLNEG